MKLQIRNAVVQYGANTILYGADFEIRDNEKIAVVGRNGCGKTTLLKLISGDIHMSNPDSDEKARFIMQGGLTVGTLRQISFEDGTVSCGEELGKAFAGVYECSDQMAEIEAQLSECSPEEHDVLLSRYEALQRKFNALGGFDCEREMLIMFQKFGFSMDDLNKPIGEFSGGQQTKIAFMKLLLGKPDILLLDEPTNHLDLPTIEWLEGYLRSYSSAVVIVSHDRAFLDGIVSVTYEIEYGRITRYPGNYTAFTVQKQAAFEKQEKDYEAQQKEIARLTEWIEKWKNTPTKVSSVHSKEKVLEHMARIEKPRRFDTKSFRAAFSPRCESYTEVLKVRDMSIGYDSVLANVTFTLRKNERLGVIGANGIGKSTLLKVLVGQIPPLAGGFEYGRNVEWGYFDQRQALINDQDPEQTILDNFWDMYPKVTREQARSALGCFVFSGEEVEKKLGQLSGGERVRLALCKMFYSRPNLLILDEPTNHMDMIGKEALEQMLENFDGSVIFVSHDRYFIDRVATCILEFSEEGTLFYDMKYQEYREEKRKMEMAASNGLAYSNSRVTGSLSKRQGPGTEKPAAEKKTDEREMLLKTNPGKLESRLTRKLAKLEEELAQSEESMLNYKEEMADPAIAADYNRLIILQEKIAEEEEKQEGLLGQIMEAEEELEEVSRAMLSRERL